MCNRRGGEGRGGEWRRGSVLTWVYFGLLCSSYRHLEARGKSQFNFLDWILKLVWDLFPYAIVALMFAAFLVINGSIVVGRFAGVMGGELSDMHIGRLVRCVWSLLHTSLLNQ